MHYRSEIDGLRSVAVIPVILFHAGVPGFGGGYVGVDVFFVISGFLITTILLMDLEQENFSLARFYERRARRILPALTVVILGCLPFAWMWMLPGEFVAFGKSVISASLFVSNIFFWTESGYFEAAGELKPLLHTWSLSVEEQYYLIFPVLLSVFWKFGRRAIIPVLVIAIILSLGLAEWGWRNAPSASFFLTPTRVWEILLGALCAVWLKDRRPKSDILSLLGICMVLYATFFFDDTTPAPSLWIAIPVVGTALVLSFARTGTFVARGLSTRPLVMIGLISYSAYLWHQPILAFARMRYIAEIPPIGIALLVALTFALAWLSWRFVERPFRNKGFMSHQRTVFAASFASIFGVCLVGITLWSAAGVPTRSTPSGQSYSDLAHLEAELAPNYGLNRDCDAKKFTLSPNCRTSDTPTTVLWGDSFAMHLAPALRASPAEIPFVQLTLSQCGPIPGLSVQGSSTTWQTCMKFNDDALDWILSQNTVETVILSSPFGQVAEEIYRSDGAVISNSKDRQIAVTESLVDLSHVLRDNGKRLVIVSPPPRNGTDIGFCSVRSQLMGEPASRCNFPIAMHEEYSAHSIALLKTVEAEIPVIWLSSLLCGTDHCRTETKGEGFYRDTGHLSVSGAARVERDFNLSRLIMQGGLGGS